MDGARSAQDDAPSEYLAVNMKETGGRAKSNVVSAYLPIPDSADVASSVSGLTQVSPGVSNSVGAFDPTPSEYFAANMKEVRAKGPLVSAYLPVPEPAQDSNSKSSGSSGCGPVANPVNARIQVAKSSSGDIPQAAKPYFSISGDGALKYGYPLGQVAKPSVSGGGVRVSKSGKPIAVKSSASGSKTANPLPQAAKSSASGVSGGEPASLAEIGRRYGAELSEAGLRLRRSADTGMARAAVLRGEAEAALNELRSTLHDLSPLPAERLTKRAVLESLSEGAAVLVAGFVGAFGGRLLGDVLGLLLPVPLALLATFVLLPAAFGVHGVGLTGKSRRLALLQVGTLMGAAFGVGTRGLPSVTRLPPLAGLAGAAVLGLGGAQLVALGGDRRRLLGAVLGLGLALELGIAALLGGVSLASLLLATLVGGVVAAEVQIALGRSRRLVAVAPVLGLAAALFANGVLMAALPEPDHRDN